MGQTELLAPLRASTIRENVAHLLENAILSGKFKPGDRLNESSLSRQLKVSRAPIREALHQLQEQGLVVSQPRRGMFVVSLTDEDIAKINALRVVLEGEALLLCRERLNPSFLRRLQQHLDRLERGSGLSVLEVMRADLAFHRTIWSNTGNEYLERGLVSLTAPLFAYSLVQKPNAELIRLILNSHRPLTEFLRGDGGIEEARAVMREHLSLGWGKTDAYEARPALS